MARITGLIFAKYPQPGKVNTRMVPPLTPEEAAALHRASLIAVCERVGTVADLTTKLVGTPDDRVADLWRIVGDGVAGCWPQGGGCLGKRLSRATNRAFDAGADGVLLLGSDSPTMPIQFLTDAVANLAKHDAVLGPSDDGGYYLFAVQRPLPALFERIDWGSDRVADQTRERAADAGIDLCELPTWYDLDRFDDLLRAVRDPAETTEPSQPASMALRSLIRTYVAEYASWTT